MADALLPGMIDGILKRERLNQPTILQVFDIEKVGNQWTCRWKDGSRELIGGMSEKLQELVDKTGLEDGGLVKVTKYVGGPDNQGIEKLMAFDLEVISAKAPVKTEVKQEPLTVKMEGVAENEPAKDNNTKKKPELESRSSIPGGKENVAPYKTPAAKKIIKYSNTPGCTPPSTGRKSVQPIQALNPYNNLWTIKARVASKTPLRSLQRNGQPYNLFTVCLVDEEGSEIEATLWREFADQWYDRIEEGKVYMISKGRVKPANKSYASTRNDYAIDLVSETQIEECADEDSSKMQAKVNFVKLDQLQPYIGKRMTVDIIGILKEVQPVGSVKRKSDGADISRRDVTVVDQSGKLARLTLWNSLAENSSSDLEKMDNPVVSITAVRVSDYDGISLSTLSRSQLNIEPSGSEAEDLRNWWQAQGSSTEFVHAGEGLASTRKSGDGRRDGRFWLKDIVKDTFELPSPDAKSDFYNIRCSVMKVDPEQMPFFYPADIATGKKVQEDENGWRLVADDKPCAAMEYRYFVRINVADATGSVDIVINNEQGVSLFGRKAEELRNLRQEKPEEFLAAVLVPQFTEWNFTVRSNTSEYKGELRQRIQAHGQFTQDYVAESKWLLTQISALNNP